MRREEILEEARKCVCESRERDYKSPEDNFKNIADLWSVYLGHDIDSVDVAIMMALLKIGRLMTGNKADNYIDLAGYAACAGEIATTARDELVAAEGA